MFLESPSRVFRQLFTDMVRGAEEDVSLGEASLYLAGEEYPEMDVPGYLQELDLMAEEARRDLAQVGDPREALRRLGDYLFVRRGFHGNADDYYDPQNSYLNRVLDRRTGIPITLGIAYMEVARRLGMVLEGIGLPGHFILRHGPPEWGLYVDPFHAGRLLDRADCEQLVHQMFGGRTEFREEFLLPYTKKATLVRVLSNLKNAYYRLGDYRRALAAAERVAILEPHMAQNLKDTAALHVRLGQYRPAIESLELYLATCGQPEDAEQVREQVRRLWRAIASRN